MSELWKEIKNTEGNYLVSNKGRIFAKSRMVKNGDNTFRYTNSHFMTPRKQNSGYLTVHIMNKNKLIHRLVAEAFIDNPLNYPQVNHRDEDKTNNCVDNLEWCTSKYNMNYGNRRKKEKQSKIKLYSVQNIDTGEIFISPKEAGEKYGINNDCITLSCRGKTKRAGGYRWRYING